MDISSDLVRASGRRTNRQNKEPCYGHESDMTEHRSGMLAQGEIACVIHLYASVRLRCVQEVGWVGVRRGNIVMTVGSSNEEPL